MVESGSEVDDHQRCGSQAGRMVQVGLDCHSGLGEGSITTSFLNHIQVSYLDSYDAANFNDNWKWANNRDFLTKSANLKEQSKPPPAPLAKKAFTFLSASLIGGFVLVGFFARGRFYISVILTSEPK
jgi:hypothetical protein